MKKNNTALVKSNRNSGDDLDKVLADFRAASEVPYRNRINDVAWVRGWEHDIKTVGVAYINGRLEKVEIRRSEPRLIVEPISVKEAAALMRDMMTAEIELSLDVHSTDEGLVSWWNDIALAA